MDKEEAKKRDEARWKEMVSSTSKKRQLTQVVGYGRKSTKDKNQKYSLFSQWLKISQFAKENDLQVVEWFEDIESGTKTNREGLRQALEHCEKHNMPLVVLRTDRLSRVPSQMFGLLEKPNLKKNAISSGF